MKKAKRGLPKGPMRKTVSWLLNASSDSYWKQQAIHAGLDLHNAVRESPIQHPWKSFYFEQAFLKILHKVHWNLQALSLFDRLQIKHYTRFIEAFSFSDPLLSAETASQLLSMLPELKIVTFHQTNGLIQATFGCNLDRNPLHTVKLVDIHLIDGRTLNFIPKNVRTVVICNARHITCDFLQGLHERPQLDTLIIRSSSLEQNALYHVPKQIQHLDLSFSGKDQNPRMLQLVPQQLLTFCCNGWSQCSDLELSYLPQTIVSIELNNWTLTELGMKELSKLPLTHCSLKECSALQGIGLLPKTLQTLNLSGNKLEKKELAALTEFVHLNTLYMQSCVLEGSLPIVSQTLTELSLAHTPITKESLEAIQKLSQLTKLCLQGCSIENGDLEALPSGLEHLDLSDCNSLTDTGAHLLQRLEKLHTLVIDRCEQIRGLCLSTLSSSIKKLSLQGCHRLSGRCLGQLPSGIEELCIANCELVEPNDLRTIPRSLQIITLSRNSRVSLDFFEYSHWSKIEENEITTLIRS